MIGKFFRRLVDIPLEYMRKKRLRAELESLREEVRQACAENEEKNLALQTYREETRRMLMRRAGEMGHLQEAVYVASNPAELSEMWYMTGDPEFNNISPVLAHQLLPHDEVEKQAVLHELGNRYGEVKRVGYTYAALPYHLGNHRMSEDHGSFLEEYIRNQNSIEQLQARAESEKDPHDREEALKVVDKIRSSPEYAVRIEEIIQRFLAEATRCLTPEELQEKIAAFYLSSPADEASVRQASLEKGRTAMIDLSNSIS